MTDTERFAYDERFTLGQNDYTLECRNFDTHDAVRVAIYLGKRFAFSSIDLPLEITNSDKKMIADSVQSDVRWIEWLSAVSSIEYSAELVERIHEVRSLGASDSIACNLVTLVHCKGPSSWDAVDIYKRFRKIPTSQYYPDADEDELLAIYSDLCLKFSMEASENILKVLQNRFDTLKRARQVLMESDWPEDCANYVAKLSAYGLDIMRSFRLDSIEEPTPWITPIIKILSELSDDELSSVIDIATEISILSATTIPRPDSESRSHYYFFFKYTAQLKAERPLIAGLMLEKYGSKNLQLADEIITRSSSTYECSIIQLLTVCEFIHNGGSTGTPIEWILQF